MVQIKWRRRRKRRAQTEPRHLTPSPSPPLPTRDVNGYPSLVTRFTARKPSTAFYTRLPLCRRGEGGGEAGGRQRSMQLSPLLVLRLAKYRRSRRSGGATRVAFLLLFCLPLFAGSQFASAFSPTVEFCAANLASFLVPSIKVSVLTSFLFLPFYLAVCVSVNTTVEL